eukprot:2299527-Pleurochrysis_carterae.AAC.3
MFRVGARAGVGDEDGMRACLAMCILAGWCSWGKRARQGSFKSTKASISQDTHDPPYVHRGCFRLHILQRVGADQLASVSHRRQIGLAGLREQS